METNAAAHGGFLASSRVHSFDPNQQVFPQGARPHTAPTGRFQTHQKPVCNGLLATHSRPSTSNAARGNRSHAHATTQSPQSTLAGRPGSQQLQRQASASSSRSPHTNFNKEDITNSAPTPALTRLKDELRALAGLKGINLLSLTPTPAHDLTAAAAVQVMTMSCMLQTHYGSFNTFQRHTHLISCLTQHTTTTLSEPQVTLSVTTKPALCRCRQRF